jgi:hypothetical protein
MTVERCRSLGWHLDGSSTLIDFEIDYAMVSTVSRRS